MKTKNTLIQSFVIALTLFSTSAHAGPDHFQPLSLDSLENGMIAYWYLTIINPEPGEPTQLWMIRDGALLKSFSAVLIARHTESETNKQNPNAPPTIYTSYYLWSLSSVPQEPVVPETKYDPELEIKARKIPVDKEFVDLMTDAWQSALKEAKFADQKYWYLDADRFIFGSGRFCANDQIMRPL